MSKKGKTQTKKKTQAPKKKTQTTKKTTANTKKDTTKKVTPPKKTTKTTKKKTTKPKEVKKEKVEPKKIDEKKIKDENLDIVFKDDVSANKCKYCNKYFEKVLTKCPFCKKTQDDKTGKIVIAVLLIILILSIIMNIIIDKYYVNRETESDYKYQAKLLSYEEMVRSPNLYKDTKVKVIGEVIKVEGIDLSKGNVMNVTLNTNLFEDDGEERLITFEYTDKDYEIGFINGDLITVYGKYAKINGNVPFIQAKYIVFGT
ncbi:MAG TPA: hypothetical protein GX713_02995 [Mollicutes bacterium]|nr:hypothetical protein [Mollicutes bacterium]